jgi:hypothetical protein
MSAEQIAGDLMIAIRTPAMCSANCYGAAAA